jgi:hypothetical protein
VGHGRISRTIVLAGVGACALIAVSTGSAQVTNRAQVGVQGRNETKGYSPGLYVVFVSPSDYRAGCCTDVDSGQWLGPRYQASGNASLGGDSSIDWSAKFDPRSTSASAAATAALVQKWPQVSQQSVRVPHVVRGTNVGSIDGTAIVTRSPAEPAQFEAVLGFPLCRGLFVAAGFALLKPFTDTTGGVAGQYMVNGMLASAWNRQQADASLQGVRLEGYLPAASLTARASGRVVTGVVRDCARHPMPGITVRAGGTRTTTRIDGSFRLVVSRRGSVLVVASGGGRTLKARVRVR